MLFLWLYRLDRRLNGWPEVVFIVAGLGFFTWLLFDGIIGLVNACKG